MTVRIVLGTFFLRTHETKVVFNVYRVLVAVQFFFQNSDFFEYSEDMQLSSSSLGSVW